MLRRKKGQLISGDFIVSIVIFLIVLAIVIPLFNRLSEESRQKQVEENVRIRLSFISDVILKKEGAPPDWNETNVQLIGLADRNGRINKTKIRNLMNMDKGSVKALMGVPDIEINVSFYSGNYPAMTGASVSPAAYFYVSDKGMLPAINGSGLVWDMYYAGVGLPDPSDARSVYTGQKAALFDQMTDVQEYRTIIIENPELTQAEINMTRFGDFIIKGGIIIFEGDAELISTGFSMSSGTDPGAAGLVVDTNFIEAAYNSTIVFNSSSWYFYRTAGDANLTIQGAREAGGAFVSTWRHGAGRVYYITDIEGSVGGALLRDAVLLVGKKAEMSTGTVKSSVVNSRTVVFGTELNSAGRMVMIGGV